MISGLWTGGVVARDLAGWLDDHPREVDPVDFLEIAHDLLDEV